MARWGDTRGHIPPGQLSHPTPDHWGEGQAGVRAWRDAACKWLYEDDTRRLPIGTGDQLAVMRHALHLMGHSAAHWRCGCEPA